MKKSRDVVGLPVIELAEGKALGRVHSLVVNPVTRRVEAMEVGERSLLKTKTDLISFDKLRSIGSDAITLQNHEAVKNPEEQPEIASLLERKLIGTRVVTADGALAGMVEDFSFDPANGVLHELFLSAEKTRAYTALPVDVVENFGRDFVIVREDYLTHARELEENITTERSSRPVVRSLEVKAIEYALGREAGQDVLDEHGGYIIRRGDKVTNESIDLARSKNRLTQLLIAAGVGELLDGVDFTREKLDAGSKRLLEAWHSLRGRSHEWLARKLEEDRPSPTGELRDLWFQLQGKLIQGSRELEETTRTKIREYVVGKTLVHPVYYKDGSVLGSRGDHVTEEMRDIADQYGRLPQLFLSAAAGDVQLALDPIKQQLKDILGD
jgi:uncharacterized protein YrrD